MFLVKFLHLHQKDLPFTHFSSLFIIILFYAEIPLPLMGLERLFENFENAEKAEECKLIGELSFVNVYFDEAV